MKFDKLYESIMNEASSNKRQFIKSLVSGDTTDDVNTNKKQFVEFLTGALAYSVSTDLIALYQEVDFDEAKNDDFDTIIKHYPSAKSFFSKLTAILKAEKVSKDNYIDFEKTIPKIVPVIKSFISHIPENVVVVLEKLVRSNSHEALPEYASAKQIFSMIAKTKNAKTNEDLQKIAQSISKSAAEIHTYKYGFYDEVLELVYDESPVFK